jgi:hypothetical protein
VHANAGLLMYILPGLLILGSQCWLKDLICNL